jgi:hypothetical protein
MQHVWVWRYKNRQPGSLYIVTGGSWRASFLVTVLVASTIDSEVQFPPKGAAVGSLFPLAKAFFFHSGTSSSFLPISPCPCVWCLRGSVHWNMILFGHVVQMSETMRENGKWSKCNQADGCHLFIETYVLYALHDHESLIEIRWWDTVMCEWSTLVYCFPVATTLITMYNTYVLYDHDDH